MNAHFEMSAWKVAFTMALKLVFWPATAHTLKLMHPKADILHAALHTALNFSAPALIRAYATSASAWISAFDFAISGATVYSRHGCWGSENGRGAPWP